MQGYVGAEIRRVNRNLLVTNIVIAALVLSLPLMFWGYVKECLDGPFPTTLENIAGLQSAGDAPHSYVRFGIDPHHTGPGDVYRITGGQEKANDHYFFLHLPHEHVLIIVGHSDELPATVCGDRCRRFDQRRERHRDPGS